MIRKSLVALVFAIISPATFAQGAGVSPVIQVVHPNKKGIAHGSFTVLNNSLLPVVTTLTIQGFAISNGGEIAMQPLDPSDVISLSATSVRVPPQGSSIVGFEADCPRSCAFFVVTNISQERRVSDGLSVRVNVPETIYCFATPMRKDDVATKWIDPSTLLVQNSGQGGDRPEVDFVAGGKTQPFPSVALMPGASRLLRFPAPPSKVVLRGEHFSMTVEHN
jgi:hypothetical protein